MSSPSNFSGFGRASLAGCDMVASVGIGALIGWWLDTITGWWPWCFVSLFFLGTVAGMRMVYRKMLQSPPPPKEKKQQPHG